MSTPGLNTPPTKEYLDEYSGHTLLAICVLFIILETVFVAMRYYARNLTPTGLGWDDAIISLAWLANVGLCILCITAVRVAGVGRHLAYVLKFHPAQFESWAKILYALEWLYLTSVALPKISILGFYLRVFIRHDTRVMCYVLLGFVTATWIAYIIASNLQCRPVAYQWNKKIAGGHCFNTEVFFKTTSVPNIATDLAIILLPIPTVVTLKTTQIRKVGLLMVFLVGSIGLIGSCIRMSTFFTHDAFIDNTWESVPLMGWSVIEPGMYLVAACLLTLRPVLRKMPFKKWKASFQHSRLYHYYHSSQSQNSENDASHGGNPHPPGEHSLIEFPPLQAQQGERGTSEEIMLPPPAARKISSGRQSDIEQGITPDEGYDEGRRSHHSVVFAL